MYSRRRELLALGIVLLLVVGLPTAVFSYQFVLRPRAKQDLKVFDMTAQTPEGGGWQPERITVRQGDRVRLQLHGTDVVHSFVLGRTDVERVVVQPGEVKSVEFAADDAGEFTFYCDIWCSPYHYRMRGVLEVLEPGGSLPVEPATSTEQQLQAVAHLIDEPHPARYYPLARPTASRGEVLAEQYAPAIAAWKEQALAIAPADRLRSASPSEVFAALGNAAPELSEADRWDLIAYLWSTTTAPDRIAAGRQLYTQNCAACHALEGTGDGPAWEQLQAEPQSFADPVTMAGGTSWIYYAKIARGGMGTGMPYFGTVFTEDEMWSLVDYLWTFLWQYDNLQPANGRR
jgi:mono/diheme cytochrome c family protein/plastocyanin